MLVETRWGLSCLSRLSCRVVGLSLVIVLYDVIVLSLAIVVFAGCFSLWWLCCLPVVLSLVVVLSLALVLPLAVVFSLVVVLYDGCPLSGGFPV